MTKLTSGERIEKLMYATSLIRVAVKSEGDSIDKVRAAVLILQFGSIDIQDWLNYVDANEEE